MAYCCFLGPVRIRIHLCGGMLRAGARAERRRRADDASWPAARSKAAIEAPLLRARSCSSGSCKRIR